ncbi:Beta-lactamase-like protein 2 [Coemansia asiatica]|uniref:Beta-lactamase-like protein 2 n=1 Tax=Coemansia asiatica TaxID=1052880 RepID=A0A9W7XFJ8_9FUNG|nr:Beta-lactamase-like protein 2 [Coemansia asiatica]
MNKPVERIARDIVRVLGLNPGPFTLQGTNTYLFGSGPRRLLVDTGDGAQPEYLKLLYQTLGDSRIDRILITHWHNDHTGGIPAILHSDMVSPDCTIFKHQHKDCPNIDGSQDISDGQVFAVDGLKLTAMLTPGHTPDHVAFLVSGCEQKMLVTGDLILGQGTTVVDDLQPYMRSLDQVLETAPSVLLPGHGPVVQGQDDQGQCNAVRVIREYIDHRHMREKQILQTMAGPPPIAGAPGWSVEQITAAVYPAITDPQIIRAAQKNVHLHLLKLKDEQKIKRILVDPLDPESALWALI